MSTSDEKIFFSRNYIAIKGFWAKKIARSGTAARPNVRLTSVTPESPEVSSEYFAARNTPAEMTTKVVKGSLWAFVGMVAPLGVSFFTTPIVIRLLGAESYGVLALVTVIPTYIAFSDLGMNLASTKFGSEAYAKGLPELEARVIRTAALIALGTTLPITLLLALLSGTIVDVLRVPPELSNDASQALVFASATFLFNVLSGVFSSPQLARLRMDINASVTASCRILGLIAIPVAIYLGAGIAGAFFAQMAASLLAFIANTVISQRMLGVRISASIERGAIRPMLGFGIPAAISLVAFALLINLEKAVLARVASVETLAYYSVAFTFANLASMFSQSMVQSLMPAFSQLLGPEKRDQLAVLFQRSIRLNLAVIIPLLFLMFSFAVPIFSIWAGPDFGIYSTAPFYVLLAGLFFGLFVYVPATLLISFGKTASIAKVHWLELLPYIGLTALLSYRYGAVGAAAAWSIRVMVDCVLIVSLARGGIGITTGLRELLPKLTASALILLPGILFVLLIDPRSPWLLAIVPVSLGLLIAYLWKQLLTAPERDFVLQRFRSYRR